MQTTGLYFGERFKVEFRPMHAGTPDLGQVARDKDGHHPFDAFEKAVVDCLNRKGVSAEAFIGDRFEVLVDGKAKTATLQRRLYEEFREAEERASTPEEDAQAIKNLLDARLRSLVSAQKYDKSARRNFPEEKSEDIACLQALVNPLPTHFSKRDFADELVALREIEQIVQEQGLLSLLTEPVQEKIRRHHSRWLPVRSREDEIDRQARLDVLENIESRDGWCELEEEPLILDYQLRQGAKSGKAGAGAEQYVFPYLHNLVQTVKRYLPASAGKSPGMARPVCLEPAGNPGQAEHSKPDKQAGERENETLKPRITGIQNPKSKPQSLELQPKDPASQTKSAVIVDFAKAKRQRTGR
jgi:hypothetical protein